MKIPFLFNRVSSSSGKDTVNSKPAIDKKNDARSVINELSRLFLKENIDTGESGRLLTVMEKFSENKLIQANYRMNQKQLLYSVIASWLDGNGKQASIYNDGKNMLYIFHELEEYFITQEFKGNPREMIAYFDEKGMSDKLVEIMAHPEQHDLLRPNMADFNKNVSLDVLGKMTNDEIINLRDFTQSIIQIKKNKLGGLADEIKDNPAGMKYLLNIMSTRDTSHFSIGDDVLDSKAMIMSWSYAIQKLLGDRVIENASPYCKKFADVLSEETILKADNIIGEIKIAIDTCDNDQLFSMLQSVAKKMDGILRKEEQKRNISSRLDKTIEDFIKSIGKDPTNPQLDIKIDDQHASFPFSSKSNKIATFVKDIRQEGVFFYQGGLNNPNTKCYANATFNFFMNNALHSMNNVKKMIDKINENEKLDRNYLDKLKEANDPLYITERAKIALTRQKRDQVMNFLNFAKDYFDPDKVLTHEEVNAAWTQFREATFPRSGQQDVNEFYSSLVNLMLMPVLFPNEVGGQIVSSKDIHRQMVDFQLFRRTTRVFSSGEVFDNVNFMLPLAMSKKEERNSKGQLLFQGTGTIQEYVDTYFQPTLILEKDEERVYRTEQLGWIDENNDDADAGIFFCLQVTAWNNQRRQLQKIKYDANVLKDGKGILGGPITFPEVKQENQGDGQPLKEITYTCTTGGADFAVVHMGGPNGGHYVAYQRIGSYYLLYDDNTCSLVKRINPQYAPYLVHYPVVKREEKTTPEASVVTIL